MMVWRKGSINRTVSVMQCCEPLKWCTMERAVLTGRLTGYYLHAGSNRGRGVGPGESLKFELEKSTVQKAKG